MERKDEDSVRIGGMKVDQLPFGARERTIPQMEKVRKNERQQKIDGIKAGAPKQSVAYCEAKVREAKANQKKIQDMRDKAKEDIHSYKMYITQCNFRDDMLKDETDKEVIRKLKVQYPPYNVEAMETQITQFEDTITNCDKVINEEIEAIRVLAGLQTLCEQRDAKLKALGVSV